MEEVLFLNARKWLDIQETRCQIWLSGLYSTQVYCAMHHSDGEDSVVNNQIRVWFFRDVTCQRKTQTKTSKYRSQMMIWALNTEQGEGDRESERRGCFCFTLGGQESLTDCVIVSVLYSADANAGVQWVNSTMLYYIRDSSICGFCYLLGVLKLTHPMEAEG